MILRRVPGNMMIFQLIEREMRAKSAATLARASVKHVITFSVVLAQTHPMTFKRITCDPKRMNGQPCVRQLRLTVRRVVEAVATYPDRRDLQREFPELEAEDIREALAYAAANLDDKVIELATAG